MKTVSLGMGHQIGTPEKIQKARTILSRMEGNPSFSNPNPSLAAVVEAATALENAYDASLDGSRSAKVMLRKCEVEFLGLMKLLSAYVQNASGGIETAIVSSGFEVKRVNRTPVVQGNPSNVRGQATNRTGEVVVRWARALGARMYTAEMSVDGTVWASCGLTTKTSLLISGLVSGSKPLFRIAALGTLGQSGWSDPGAVNVH